MPWVVVGLMLINALVFSAQFNDDARIDGAERFYRESVLYTIEPELYQRWLQDHPAPAATRQDIQPLATSPLDDQSREELAGALQVDGDFLDALTDGRLLPRSSPQRPAWESARHEFDKRLHSSLLYAGAFIPREHRPHTFLTSMFLHADAMHLIGNMVFLWLAGMLLEPLLGGGLFLALYLATGLISCAGSWLISPGSAIPELGASGAISGVMGALGMVYGARRMPCLVSIGLHAWRATLRGYWLVLIWIAWEAIQWVWMPSNVNRMAHIGGLFSGGLMGLIARRRAGVNQRAEASISDREPMQRMRAKRLAADMDYERAAATMLSLARSSRNPSDWEMLWAYARHVPTSAAGKEARQLILDQPLARDELRATLLQLKAEVKRWIAATSPEESAPRAG